MHGWPHTFALQLELAERLPDFDVVLPSFPGFEFSTPYDDSPITAERLAHTMHTPMTDVLASERYPPYGEYLPANFTDLPAASYPQHTLRHMVIGPCRERGSQFD